METLTQRLKPWLEATRPKTLAAGIIPVLIGVAAASSQTEINFGIAALVLICSILIQIITNYINEIYDFKKGADTESRLGPRRQVASGNISLGSMTIVSTVLIIITLALGLVIVAYSDLWILLVGVLSLFFAFAYTGGPYPLAYNGLGEIFVFLFFGVIAVNGTYYIFTGEINYFSLLASFPPGFLSANLLQVNNIRDIETDELVNKKTLAVKIGRSKAILLYQAFNYLSFLPIALIILFINDNYFLWLPLVTIPLAMKLNFEILKHTGKSLNKILGLTAGLLFIFGILFIIGLFLA